MMMHAARASLRLSDDLFRLLFERSPMAIVLVRRADQVVLDANPRFCSLVEREREELVGRSAADAGLIADPAQRDELLARLESSVGRVEGDITLVRADGVHRLFTGAAERLEFEGASCFLLMGEDATERRRAELRLKAAFNASPLPKAITDPTGRFIDANEALLRLLGRMRDEVIGRSIDDLVELETSEPRGTNRERLVRGESVVNQPITIRVKGGGVRQGLVSSSPILVAGDLQFMSIFTDLTSHRAMETALRESEERNRQFAERVTLGIGRSTPAGTLVSANGALARILGGQEPGDVLGRSMQEFYADPAVRERLVQDRRSTLAMDLEWRRLDGQRIIVHLTGWLLEDESDGATFEFMVEDVTEHRVLEQALARAQKMEAVGQLTAGIAHDFNNLLTVVLANAGTMGREGSDSRPLSHREALGDIVSAAESGKELVRKLLNFGRETELRVAPHDLCQLVERFSSILRRVLSETIELTLQVEDGTIGALVDRVAIEQILMNLGTNARDAMPQGGRLDVRVARMHGVPPAGGVGGEGFACISVRDTGVGMDRDTLGRIFEPFFTTKGEGLGTGLGLAVAYGLVKGMGGVITVESEPGRGTSFEIILPTVDLVEAVQAKVPDCADLRGTEGVLIVEDQADLRRTAERVLSSFGYRVASAANGQEALQHLADGATPDLILSDLVMPQLGGLELLQALRDAGWRGKFMLTSGYATDEALAREHDVDFLQKPWTMDEIGLAVREVLAR